jgi:hypothetical protein
MTPWRDVEGKMRRMQMDSQTADRLLTGRVEPDDAPPGYAGAARLLQMARVEVALAEVGRERETVAAMAAVRKHRQGRPRNGRSRTMNRSLKLKIGGAALVAAVMGSSGLAVAGALPGPAQRAAAHVLDKIGVSLPGGSHHQADSTPPSKQGTGPDATGPAKFGLCTAFASGQGGTNGGKNDAVAFRNLQAAAETAGQSVEEFCAGAIPGGASTGHPGVGSTHGAAHRGGSPAGSQPGDRSAGGSGTSHRP